MFRKIESGMVFGDYQEERVFPIEDLAINQKLGNELNTVEFIYSANDKQIDFIEAKSSTPQESTDPARFKEFIDEIGRKFEHSFEIMMSTYLERQDIKLPDGFQTIDYGVVSFKFIFVINGHRPEWLPPVLQALKKRLSVYNKIWKCGIIVWNHTMAEEAGYIKQMVL